LGQMLHLLLPRRKKDREAMKVGALEVDAA
jgi:hypothetical protein